MAVIRSGFDRRSNVNRRQMHLTVNFDRRINERRQVGELRNKWVRTSQWSSVDQEQMNRYFWHMLE